MSYVNVQDSRLPFVLRYISELVAYRHLCWNLVASDLRARFRRTKLGILWAVIQPLAFALIMAMVWGNVHHQSSYWQFAAYVFSGQIVFEKFSNAVIASQDSLLGAGGYLKQARIPFLIFQVRNILSGSVILFFAVIGLFIFLGPIGMLPAFGWHLLLIPLFFLIYPIFLTPIAVILSIASLQFRDLKHISGLVVQAVFLLSPVMLPRDILDQPHLKFLEVLNPMVPVLDMFRDPVLYSRLWNPQDVLLFSCWTVGLWTLAIVSSVSAGRKLIYAI